MKEAFGYIAGIPVWLVFVVLKIIKYSAIAAIASMAFLIGLVISTVVLLIRKL